MLRALAFGDLGGEHWGAVLSPGGGLDAFAVLGAGRSIVPAKVEGDSSPASEWWVTGEGLDLAVAPGANGAAEGGAGVSGSTMEGGFDQLVTVRGELSANGAREVELLGCRGERDQALAPGDFGLLRDIRAWFSPREGLALLAVRPRRGSTHADERLSATLFEGGQSVAVEEPRLSTTYGDDGLPIRATLELWLPESESEEPDEDAEPVVNYPRRAAGEAAGPASAHEIGSLSVQVRPFKWRAAGREGAGVYLMARTR
jgi:hypothetical protein